MTITEREDYRDMIHSRMSVLKERRNELLAIIRLETYGKMIRQTETLDKMYADLLVITREYDGLNNLQYSLSKGH